MSPDFEARLIDAALQESAEGPLTIDGLVVALRRRGVLGPLEPYENVQVSEELAMVPIDTDDAESNAGLVDDNSTVASIISRSVSRNLQLTPCLARMGSSSEVVHPTSYGVHQRLKPAAHLIHCRDSIFSHIHHEVPGINRALFKGLRLEAGIRFDKLVVIDSFTIPLIGVALP